jgi:hypothetical protein
LLRVANLNLIANLELLTDKGTGETKKLAKYTMQNLIKVMNTELPRVNFASTESEEQYRHWLRDLQSKYGEPSKIWSYEAGAIMRMVFFSFLFVVAQSV